jgi:hypothetical protein
MLSPAVLCNFRVSAKGTQKLKVCSNRRRPSKAVCTHVCQQNGGVNLSAAGRMAEEGWCLQARDMVP